MKKSIIKEMLYWFKGEGEPIKMTDKEHKLISEVSDIYDELQKELTPKQKEQQKNLSQQESTHLLKNPIINLSEALSWDF